MKNRTHRGRIAAEAASHFARLQSESATPEDHADAEAWIDQSGLHRQAWIDANDLWLGVGPLAGPLTSKKRRPRFIAAGAVGALAASLLLVVAVGLFALRQPPLHVRSSPAAPATFQTARGEKSDVVLSDGSIVTLDAASRVRVSMGPRSRRVVLEQGRAEFAVAKDAGRPFVVSAGDQTVTATGTKFVVSVTPSEMDVGLVEGRVRVEKVSSGSPMRQPVRAIEMQRGDWLTAPDDGQWMVVSMPSENMLSWVSGVLVFQNASLEEIAAEMNRYTRSPIVIADAATAHKRLTAVVAAGDIETLRTGVLRLGIAKVRRRSDGALEFYSGVQPAPAVGGAS